MNMKKIPYKKAECQNLCFDTPPFMRYVLVIPKVLLEIQNFCFDTILLLFDVDRIV